MTKFLTVVSMSAFLVFSGISVFAGQAGMNKQEGQSEESPSMKGGKNKGSIESKSSTSKQKESEEQKGARPGGVGEDDPTTSTFGSPATLPPGEHSPGYTGADKQAEDMEQRLQNERSGGQAR